MTVRFIVEVSKNPSPRSKYTTRNSISVGSPRELMKILPFRCWPAPFNPEEPMTVADAKLLATFYYSCVNVGNGFKKRLVHEERTPDSPTPKRKLLLRQLS